MSKKKKIIIDHLLPKLLVDLGRLPEFRVIDEELCLARCKNFHIRWRYEENHEWYLVEFGVIETFDRWDNSCDFATNLNYTHPYRPDVLKDYEWMLKVLDTGLFDFNKYIGTVNCPGYDMIRNE